MLICLVQTIKKANQEFTDGENFLKLFKILSLGANMVPVAKMMIVMMPKYCNMPDLEI